VSRFGRSALEDYGLNWRIAVDNGRRTIGEAIYRAMKDEAVDWLTREYR